MEILSEFAARPSTCTPSHRPRRPVRFQLTVSLRQPEESPAPTYPPATDWFFVVDRVPTMTEDQCTLGDGSVVLSLSATPADARAVAPLDGIDIVRYAQMSEADRSVLRQHLARRERGNG